MTEIVLPPLVRVADGTPARWSTRVGLRTDDRNLHVRFECRDEHCWATLAERDAPLWREEVVEVFLAPGVEAPERYWEFEVNPLGALFDAVVDNPAVDNPAVDNPAVESPVGGNRQRRRETMTVDTTRDLPGIAWSAGPASDEPSSGDWWAELVLPWRALVAGLGSSSDEIPRHWRANFYRVERPGGPSDPSRDEYTAWSATRRDPPDFHVPERFGHLVLGDETTPEDGLPVVRLHREARETG